MKARKILLAVMTIASVMMFNACSEDPCEGVTCNSHGTPTEALGTCSCNCDTGWSGSNCDVEDSCITQNVTCLNGGTCDNGSCDCVAGYEGDSCQTLSRVKFLGTYDVSDSCSSSGSATYQITVAASGVSSEHAKVLISNFWDTFTNNVQATVNGNTITIPTQEPDNDGFTVTGTGTINGTAITVTVNFSVADGTTTDVCQSTWTKQ